MLDQARPSMITSILLVNVLVGLSTKRPLLQCFFCIALRSPQLHCTYRNPGCALKSHCATRNATFGVCSETALNKTKVALRAATLRSKFSLQTCSDTYYTHRNQSCTLCATTLHSPKPRLRSVQWHYND